MESTTSDQGVRPKNTASTIGEDSIAYGQLLLTLELLLTRQHACKLATWFGYPAGMIDNISNSDTPSRVLVQFMDERGEISPTDISKLIDALENKTVGLGGVAVKVKEAFALNVPKLHPTPVSNEKKTQFFKELRNKYKNLCGGILPAPFLRDKCNIDQLFVESKIEFLEEKQGEGKEKEKWIGIEKYKTVFTDPRIKSKRLIIDGDPGFGKSTLALQITHDWCQEKAPIKDFEILILLRLRQFRNVPTVFSAIKKFLLPKDSKLTEDDIESILDCSSTVILFDGYDEYPDRGNKDTDVEHIIRGDMFLKHDVVLTTRTSCLPPECSCDTKRIRLTGFDDDSRDKYIRNVAARGCSDVADKISQFLKVDPVPAFLCENPLFFSMISYMAKNSERFRNLKTVTHFFRHIIECFHSHRDIKVSEGNRKEKLDHSKLDKIAFEGLSGDVQQISWCENTLRGKIGNYLYDEYVSIGILIEEEGFDYDSLKYNTETRFFHKLFAEWYAAHYFAKVAAQSVAEFEPWPQTELERFLNIADQETGTVQPQQAENSERVHSLKSMNPHDVHYMYRYACGLNPLAALKIIKHFGTNRYYDHYTLLCMTEWGGNFETIMDTITTLCSREIHFSHRDILLLQRSTVELIEFASSRKIPMYQLQLYDCLDVGSAGNLCLKPSNLSLPAIDTTLTLLIVFETGRELTEEETDSIFQYSAMCLGLRELQFSRCLPPRYIKETESLCVLRSRHVKVKWWSGRGYYVLNLESNQWENFFRGTKLTDEVEYQKAVEDVRGWAKERKFWLGKD